MKKEKCLGIAVVVFLLLGLQAIAFGQTEGETKLATLIGGGSSVRWEVTAPNSGGTLTITTPDNRAFRRTFRGGASPEISLADKQMEGLPDGVYSYELRLAPALTPAQKETLLKARGNDDDPEAERAARRRPTVPGVVQSGSFAIVNGSIVVAGAVENARTGKTNVSRPIRFTSGNTLTRLYNHRVALGAMPDVVTADDEIIQGSLCVGLDCVNNESFSFDTIRLKENNTRITFMDTSTSTGFPTEDWTIRANSSSSGGASFLAFVDKGTTSNGDESGTIVFEVDAGANANSLKVGSNSKIGLRTATPVLDVHMNTSDTPAIRFEQNNSGGFTAQTWDVAGNEANFFVRDVTGGSRLPLRIRPGAPTSSIDISASGNVGVGTASPSGLMHLFSTSNAGTSLFVQNSDTGGKSWRILSTGSLNAGGAGIFGLVNATDDASNYKFMITASGNVGIATSAPTDTLSVNGTASKPGGGSWAVFSDERLKNIGSRFSPGLKAVMQLQPLRYQYKRNNPLGLKSDSEHIGFSAQSVQKVIPEAVTQSANGYLMVNNDPILWTMLNAIQEQQREITQLKKEITRLRHSSRRNHR